MPFYTPLRYPGGKRKLLYFFKALITVNQLENCAYIEPYAGGAGLAVSLLFEKIVSSIYINDISQSVYAFWNAVLNDTDSLCRKIYDTPITIEEWFKQKDVQKNPMLFSTTELGFSTFFLNRTNRSGILKGGVIGGKEQEGTWHLDARFTKNDLVRRIQSIADRRTQIHISNKDAITYVNELKTNLLHDSVLFYFDPPYFEKGADLYDDFYEEIDHINVGHCIQKLSYPWVISYDNHPVIRNIYKKCLAVTYSLNYTAQNKKRGTEFMAFSKKLSLPPFVPFKERYFSLMHDLTQVT